MPEEHRVSIDAASRPGSPEAAGAGEPLAPGNEGNEQLIRDYQEQIRRTQADFENYRRRTEERMAVFADEANSQLVLSILPVLDNFERALAAAREHPDPQALREGVALIHRQFLEVLERAGVSRLPARGEPFDPERYEAVDSVESTEVPPLHVLEELRAGYALKSKVLRPTLVRVAKGPEKQNLQKEAD